MKNLDNFRLKATSVVASTSTLTLEFLKSWLTHHQFQDIKTQLAIDVGVIVIGGVVGYYAPALVPQWITESKWVRRIIGGKNSIDEEDYYYLWDENAKGYDLSGDVIIKIISPHKDPKVVGTRLKTDDDLFRTYSELVTILNDNSIVNRFHAGKLHGISIGKFTSPDGKGLVEYEGDVVTDNCQLVHQKGKKIPKELVSYYKETFATKWEVEFIKDVRSGKIKL